MELLISKQDAWNELANPYKVGQFRFGKKKWATDDDESEDLKMQDFKEMSLDIETASVNVKFKDKNKTEFEVYVDANTNLIVVKSNVWIEGEYVNLRPAAVTGRGLYGECDDYTVSADVEYYT